MNIYVIGTLVKLALIVIALIVGFIREEKLSNANRLFLFFLVVALPGEIMDALMARIYENNFLYYHTYRPIYYALLTIALLGEMGRLKNALKLSIGFVYVAAILNGYYLQPPTTSLNTIIIVLTCLLLIIQILFYIARLFDRNNWQETIHQYSFWIAMGILINSISSFLSMGIHNFLSREGQVKVIPILIVSEWLFYLSFIINFTLQKKRVTG